MKKIFPITLILIFLSAFAFAQTADEQAVMKVKSDIVNAVVKGDAKTLDRLIADNSTDTSTDGFVGTKQDVLNGLQPLDNISINVFDMKVRVYGKAAVAIGKIEVKFKHNGQENSDYVRFTDTFVKGKNGWQVVASQQTKIPVWQARKMEDGELKPFAALPCSEETGLKSLNSDVAAFHRVVNSTNQPIKVVWINYQGKREDKPSVVEAGKTNSFNTYLTHPFLITDAGGKCLGIYQPTREPGIVIIK